MTQEAIDARLKPVPNMSAFSIDQRNPSIYNNANFDVTWKDTLEPESTFLTEKGAQNETLTNFLSTQPSYRDRRPARGLAALAFFTVVMGAIIDTPMHSYYTSPSSLYAPPGIPPASAFTV